MIGLALLFAATASNSAIEAEQAFASMAQTEGQWTAFRAFAAPDGVMFVPARVNAQQWLKDRADPPVAVMWWPGRGWVSCDGNVAVNTGPWVRSGGKSVGYFTTVWARTRSGWKWLLDHGDALKEPRAATDAPKVHRASCKGRPSNSSNPPPIELGTADAKIDFQSGASHDRTLRWSSQVDQATGARTVTVQIWNGSAYETVLEDEVAGSAE